MTTSRTDPLPGQPRDADGPVFREAWEAQAFAMTLVLHERGVFTWKEWSATLAEEIRVAQAAGDPDTGVTYYQHWLKALERLVVEKQCCDGRGLARDRPLMGGGCSCHAARETDHAETAGGVSASGQTRR